MKTGKLILKVPGYVSIGPNLPITIPLRPMKGGNFDLASVGYSEEWMAQPKWNGWRAIIHAPSKAMFNRHGQRMSIQSQFSMALEKLRTMCSKEKAHSEWFDCEVLERRGNLRGKIILLDWIYRDVDLDIRFSWLRDLCASNGISETPFFRYDNENVEPLCLADTWNNPKTLWLEIKRWNEEHPDLNLFEGIVAKKVTSKYPYQINSTSLVFPQWVKHRFSD